MSQLMSIVVPCFNEEETIPLFLKEMSQVIPNLPDDLLIEYVFINDGSSDDTLSVMRKFADTVPNFHYLSFSRNFGKEAALFAGLEHAKGDYVVVMDVDLQDPPSLLPQMYDKIQNSQYDCIGTRRINRKGEPKIRSLFAKLFYRVNNKISDVTIVDGARDFRLMNRQMIDALLELKEYNRFSKGLFNWVGFDTFYIDYENIERSDGDSSWSFKDLFKYSLDGLISFSVFPLSLASFIGLLSFVGAIIALIFIFVRALIFGDPTSGWPSLVCIILALGGLQLFCLGIVGQYLGKMFLEVKGRPIYIIKEKDDTVSKYKNS